MATPANGLRARSRSTRTEKPPTATGAMFLLPRAKNDEARSKFIEGIVADPYSRRSWTGLQNWLQRNKVQLNDVRLKDGAAVTQKDDKNRSEEHTSELQSLR